MYTHNDKGEIHGSPALDNELVTAYYVDGLRHRDGDAPAVINKTGACVNEWYVNGLRHRDGDKPAVIDKYGRAEWWVNGERHRDEGKPAVVDGSHKRWYVNGKPYRPDNLPTAESTSKIDLGYKNVGPLRTWHNARGEKHRDNDLPAEIDEFGNQRWYTNGVHYRAGGAPSTIEASGTMCWTDEQGLLHREGNAPACITSKGVMYWYSHGTLLRDKVNTTPGCTCDTREWKRHPLYWYRTPCACPTLVKTDIPVKTDPPVVQETRKRARVE